MSAFRSFLIAAAAVLNAVAGTHAGYLIVSHDEWIVSDFGFANGPGATRFVQNVTALFSGGKPGKFLAYSDDFSLTGSSLRDTVIAAGHAWTVSTSVPFTLATLQQYAGVFLANMPDVGQQATMVQVLMEYLQAGGNIFIMAGTAGPSDLASSAWNPLLATVGLEYSDVWNGIEGIFQPTQTAHPVFEGVGGLYFLNGNTIADLDIPNPAGVVLLTGPAGEGLLAIGTYGKISPNLPPTPVIRGEVAGEPEGTKYLAFGTPQVGAFSATISGGTTGTPVIIGPDRTVLLRVGGEVPDFSGFVITRLAQPNGDAVLATLKIAPASGISARDNVVLLRGLDSGAPQLAARTGTANAALPAGVTIKSFGTIDGNGPDIFFFATLQGTDVTPQNAFALCAALGDGSVKVLARVGGQVAGRKIATIGTLVGSAATLAEGRWRVDDTTCGVRLTFADAVKSQALYAIPGAALTPDDWTPLAQTGVVSNIAAINGAKIVSFGLPGFGAGASASVIANLAITPGGPTAANHFALIKATEGLDSIVLARTGDAIATDANGAPLAGTRIAGFLDPVAGTGGRVAFAVSMIRPGGLVSRGIMSRRAGQTPALLANVGAQAPGGGRWSALGALALPDGADSGPVFLGTLAVNTAGGVTTKNNAGLWGVDSTGTLRLLLRTGQPVTIGAATKTLKSFVGLLAAPGSIGAASTFDNEGRIAVHATCTDGTRALMVVEIP